MRDTRFVHIWGIGFFVVSMFLACNAGIKPKHETLTELKYRVDQHLQNKDFEAAIRACDSIINIEHHNSWAYIQKAIALHYLSRYSESVENLDYILTKDSSLFNAYYWRGNGRKVLGDTLGAISDYTNALSIDPTSSVVLNNRGNLYSSLHLKDKAISDFLSAVVSDSTFSTGWMNLGNMYADKLNYDSAVFFFSRGITIKPNAGLYHGRGLVYYKMEQYELAVSDFTVSILYDPNSSLTYLYRAYAYADLGKRTQMCEDFSKAAQLGNMDAKKYYALNCYKM